MQKMITNLKITISMFRELKEEIENYVRKLEIIRTNESVRARK